MDAVRAFLFAGDDQRWIGERREQGRGDRGVDRKVRLHPVFPATGRRHRVEQFPTCRQMGRERAGNVRCPRVVDRPGGETVRH